MRKIKELRFFVICASKVTKDATHLAPIAQWHSIFKYKKHTSYGLRGPDKYPLHNDVVGGNISQPSHKHQTPVVVSQIIGQNMVQIENISLILQCYRLTK